MIEYGFDHPAGVEDHEQRIIGLEFVQRKIGQRFSRKTGMVENGDDFGSLELLKAFCIIWNDVLGSRKQKWISKLLQRRLRGGAEDDRAAHRPRKQVECNIE